MSKTYLTTFFSEKNINYQLFEIVDANNLTHFIDTEFVIEAILNTSSIEQQVISSTLRKLDFYNQPINDYLKHLAKALVKKFNNSL
ncbi:MAG: hypothetical protein ABIP51_20005 [Bacteroidia bacterium]